MSRRSGVHDGRHWVFMIARIRNMQANKLKDYLDKELGLPILSHPFTPQKFHRYMDKVQNNHLAKNSPQESTATNSSLVAAVNNDTYKQFNGHVLLVEDNAINQIVAGDMIEDMGLSYDLAEDGKQSVDKICSGSHYDIVLMDVQMPIMDGYEATRTVRAKGLKNLIICGLSANAMKQDLHNAEESGMDEYVTKPIELSELERVFSKHLKAIKT
ncbi:MAG: CheY-like chemotaxis protein [Flavobacteriales bacterium]|jgi:CheY-like chemotaxis protein